MSMMWKLATALGVAGAVALSAPQAEARGGRNAAIGFGVVAGALALGAAAAASQPRYYHYDGYHGVGPYAYQPAPYAYGSYNYYEAPTVYYSPSPYYSRSRSQEYLGAP